MDDDARAAHGMSVAPILQPENFQPWNDLRPDGRTLFEAMLAFVSGGLRQRVSLHLAKLSAGIEDQDASERLYAHCWTLLLRRLRQGELTAIGRLRGKRNRQVIEADLFDDAKRDFKNNRIICYGIAFGSVLVFEILNVTSLAPGSYPPAELRHSEVSPGEPITAVTPLSLTRSGAADAARVWMKENVTAPGWKREIAVADCCLQTGATVRQSKAAWMTLKTELRGTRGPHKRGGES